MKTGDFVKVFWHDMYSTTWLTGTHVGVLLKKDGHGWWWYFRGRVKYSRITENELIKNKKEIL